MDAFKRKYLKGILIILVTGIIIIILYTDSKKKLKRKVLQIGLRYRW